MVIEMKKLNLVAMANDRNRLLNALERTGAVEVKQHAPDAFAHALSTDTEALAAEYAEAENTLEILLKQASAYASDHKLPFTQQKEIELSYTEFQKAGDDARNTRSVIDEINRLSDERNALNTELNRLERALKSALVYEAVEIPFSRYCETPSVVYKLGIVERRLTDGLCAALGELPLTAYQIVAAQDSSVFAVCYYKGCRESAEKALSEVGFVQCPYRNEQTGREQCETLRAAIKEKERALGANGKAFYDLAGEITALKIYSDYIHFELEKTGLSDMMLATDRTILMEAYVPVTAVGLVEKTLNETSSALYYEFSAVPEDETPPTLLKNNSVVEGFESLTNMYSVPNAREFDPNTVMAVFYSIFLGYIMADAGYGLLMMLGGGFLWLKNRARPTALSRLACVFAVGGIFSIVWGFLFNSFFGLALLPFTVMPDAKDAMWGLAGIAIPSELILCMLFGIVHLGTGYVCKAVQCWRRKQIADGIFDGLIWAVFSIGVFLLLMGFVDDFQLSALVPVGGITAAAMLVIAIFTAGRKEKIIGKFTKGFGAVYGIINYVSDILSYARLYGLMLSGAVIASLVSDYSVQFIAGGNFGFILLGVVLMLVGHVFNLVISLLGAYIHDSRLQYMEFYGKFYEGDGRLFAPLGSNKKYVYVNSD